MRGSKLDFNMKIQRKERENGDEGTNSESGECRKKLN